MKLTQWNKLVIGDRVRAIYSGEVYEVIEVTKENLFRPRDLLMRKVKPTDILSKDPQIYNLELTTGDKK